MSVTSACVRFVVDSEARRRRLIAGRRVAHGARSAGPRIHHEASCGRLPARRRLKPTDNEAGGEEDHSENEQKAAFLDSERRLWWLQRLVFRTAPLITLPMRILA